MKALFTFFLGFCLTVCSVAHPVPKPKLLIFYADDCPHCQRMHEAIGQNKAFERAIYDTYEVVRVEIHSPAGQPIARQWNVRAVPALLIEGQSGNQTWIKGFSSLEKLEKALFSDGKAWATTPTFPLVAQANATTQSSCQCGNGIKDADEQCDDGNNASGDGCSATCRVESRFACSGNTPSVCTFTCGNGNIDAGEQCDDGNWVSGDGCSSSCRLESGDNDGDGIDNLTDRCPFIFNPDQADSDLDNIGDVCDNCPATANSDQLNSDGDSFGDACDIDTDNDGIANASDNCPLVASSNQADRDQDGVGDVCDMDNDNDGIVDGCDSCPTVANGTPLVIGSQPATGSAVRVGGPVSTSVGVTGTGPLTYQWYKDGQVLASQTSATLSLSNVQISDAGSYSVVVTGACNSVTSSAFSLTVNAPPAYALATLRKIRTNYSDNGIPADISDDRITYQLQLGVAATNPTGQTITTTGLAGIVVPGLPGTNILVSDALPIGMELGATPTAPTGWVVVYSTSPPSTPANAATWSTSQPPLATVTRIGCAKTTVDGDASTYLPARDGQFTLFDIVAKVRTGQTAPLTVANLAQVFGKTPDTNAPVLDESGDANPSNFEGPAGSMNPPAGTDTNNDGVPDQLPPSVPDGYVNDAADLAAVGTDTNGDNGGDLISASANAGGEANVFTLNPIVATLTGTSTVCAGGSATLVVAITGGSGPYSISLSNGSATTEVSNYSSGQGIVVSPAMSTTYTIVAVRDGGHTASVANQGTAVVTVNTPPTRLYVNASAIGTNTGLSWQDAFTDLQSALTYPCSQSLTEVWVAQGTYKPTAGSDRTISFAMRNGVSILGGFPNTGNPTLTDRNPASYTTILSGDLRGDDGPNFANNADNSYHVIRNNELDNMAMLDGFVITGGNANGGGNSSFGGAIYNAGSSPSITNCSFQNNTASGNGGALYNGGINFSNSSITNCHFQGNNALQGGAICNDNSNPIIANCNFQNNTALGGGAIFNLGGRPSIANCSFLANSATSGGAIYNFNNSPSLLNCSFQGNSATQIGGAIWNNDGNPSLTNCVLWNNGGANTFANANVSSVQATYSLFDNTTNVNVSGPGNLTTNTSPFASTTSVALNDCSPAINAGEPASVTVASGPYSATALPQTDLVGNPRIVGGRVDIGAVEYQGTPLAVAITALPSATLTAGQRVTLTASGADAYTWSTGEKTPSIMASPASTTAYSVTGTSGVCSATTSVQVEVAGPCTNTPTVTGNLTFCQGASTTLTLNSTNGRLSLQSPATGAYATTVAPFGPQAADVTGELVYPGGSESQGCNTPLTADITGKIVLLDRGNCSFATQATNAQAGGATGVIIVNNTTGPVAFTGVAANITIPVIGITQADGQALKTQLQSGAVSGQIFIPPTTYDWLPAEGLNTPSGRVVTASPTQTTTYTITTTSMGASGCTSMTTVTVSVNALPTLAITASPGLTINTGESSTLTASGAATYGWNTGAPTAAISVSTAGTYSVTGTNSAGCSSVTAVMVFERSCQTTLAASVAQVCVDKSVSLTATTTSQVSEPVNRLVTPTNAYTWTAPAGAGFTGSTNSGVVSASFTTSGVKTFTVTVSVPGGCISTNTVSVTVNALPMVNITANPGLTINTGESTTLTASEAASYAWSNVSSATAVVVSSAGVYSVTGISSAGCVSTTAVTVYERSCQTSLAASLNQVCVDKSVSLTALTTSQVAGPANNLITPTNAYTWTAPAGATFTGPVTGSVVSASFTTSGVKTFTVVVSVPGGCISTNTVSVTVNALPSLAITASPGLTINTGESTTLTASGAATYEWNTGAATGAISVSTAGTYSVTGTSSAGCSSVTAVTVSERSCQTTLAASAPQVCVDKTVSLTALTTSQVAGPANSLITPTNAYTWTAPAGATFTEPVTGSVVSASFATSGVKTFTVVVSVPGGCISTNTVSVTVNSLPTLAISASPGLTINTGESTTLTASGANTYGWNPGAATGAISISTAGVYSVTGISSAGCSSVTGVTVYERSCQTTLAASVAQVCVDKSVSLTATTTSQVSGPVNSLVTPTNAYTWIAPAGTNFTGSTSTSVVSASFTTSGVKTFTVLVSVPGGCISTNTVSVTVNSLPTPTLAALPSPTLTGGLAATLVASGGVSYLFSGTGLLGQNPTSGTATANQPGTYSVVVTNAAGCSALATLTLTLPQPLFTDCGSPTATIGQPLQLIQPVYNCATGVLQFRTIGGNGSPITFSAIGITGPTTSCTALVDSQVAQDIRDGRPNVEAFALLAAQGGVVVSYRWDALGACAGGPQPANRAPVAPIIPLQQARQEQAFSMTLPVFADPDGDALTYSVQGLPTNGLSFDVTTRTISGTPSVTGLVSVTAVAADPAGLSAAAPFSISVSAPVSGTVNRAPVAVAIGGQTATVGQTFLLALPLFSDPDGDALTYTVQGLPANGLVFDANTRIISGTPSLTGVLSLTLTATDGGGLSASSPFGLTVRLAPVVVGGPLRVTQPLYDCQTGSFTFQTTGGSGGPIEYMAVGITGWTSVAGPYIVKPFADAGPFTLRARQSGQETSYVWDWKAYCNNPTPPQTNVAPVASVVASQTITLGQAVNLTIPPFPDANGDVLSYAATQLPPSGLAFNLSTLVLSGTPSATGVIGITITATDPGGLTASLSFSITVQPPSVVVGGPLQLLQPLYNCQTGAFTFQTLGGNGSTIEYFAVGITGWSVVAGPYTVRPFADAGPFTLRARQSGVETSVVWNWKAYCANARVGSTEPVAGWTATMLGNPVTGEWAEVAVSSSMDRSLVVSVTDAAGRPLSSQTKLVGRDGAVLRLRLGLGAGVYLLHLSDGGQQQTLRVVRQ